eukprot:TRINITY_DN923_c0_g1_i1.p1 TRINITY_DN923_c0_g1~~TRINITY_DN923_c0_g1_i1.p1  ORF type:complete len:533 (+),score=117.40 TRINITY_DN923_c0_g1_i1:153-1751(+)
MYNFFSYGARRNPDAAYDDKLSDYSPSYPAETRMIELASYVPVRLTMPERKQMRLLTNALKASRYTDRVDVPGLDTGARNKRQVEAICGLLMGCLYGTREDHKMESGRVALDNPATLVREAPFLQHLFELLRRYKMMNPAMMRSPYAKMMHLLMDARTPQLHDELGFDLVKPIRTVQSTLQDLAADALLKDPLLPHAVTPVPLLADRRELNKALRHKDLLVKELLHKYAGRDSRRQEQIEMCIRSIGDANCHVRDTARVIDRMISFLRAYFDPKVPTKDGADRSLAIATGQEGARLDHAHSVQYTYVLQSLAMWKVVSQEMPLLWECVEQDVFATGERPYDFRDTGQGFARVQSSPQVLNAMSKVLQIVAKEHGALVGSEKVHIGDDQVPNALIFVDKYCQVARIITPILRTIDHVVALFDTPAATGAAPPRRGRDAPPLKPHEREGADVARGFIRATWGDPDRCVVRILQDFFRHAFDGSGGDTMLDAGPCIDGRLTSAWNWCQNIRHKDFYPVFLMAGFSAFDDDLEAEE